jgi:hypothetical protein
MSTWTRATRTPFLSMIRRGIISTSDCAQARTRTRTHANARVGRREGGGARRVCVWGEAVEGATGQAATWAQQAEWQGSAVIRVGRPSQIIRRASACRRQRRAAVRVCGSAGHGAVFLATQRARCRPSRTRPAPARRGGGGGGGASGPGRRKSRPLPCPARVRVPLRRCAATMLGAGVVLTSGAAAGCGAPAPTRTRPRCRFWPLRRAVAGRPWRRRRGAGPSPRAAGTSASRLGRRREGLRAAGPDPDPARRRDPPAPARGPRAVDTPGDRRALPPPPPAPRAAPPPQTAAPPSRVAPPRTPPAAS